MSGWCWGVGRASEGIVWAMNRVRSFGWRGKPPGSRALEEAGPETPAMRRCDRAVADPMVSIAACVPQTAKRSRNLHDPIPGSQLGASSGARREDRAPSSKRVGHSVRQQVRVLVGRISAAQSDLSASVRCRVTPSANPTDSVERPCPPVIGPVARAGLRARPRAIFGTVRLLGPAQGTSLVYLFGEGLPRRPGYLNCSAGPGICRAVQIARAWSVRAPRSGPLVRTMLTSTPR